MSNSFGFGGTNATLVFARSDQAAATESPWPSPPRRASSRCARRSPPAASAQSALGGSARCPRPCAGGAERMRCDVHCPVRMRGSSGPRSTHQFARCLLGIGHPATQPAARGGAHLHGRNVGVSLTQVMSTARDRRQDGSHPHARGVPCVPSAADGPGLRACVAARRRCWRTTTPNPIRLTPQPRRRRPTLGHRRRRCARACRASALRSRPSAITSTATWGRRRR